MTTSHKQAHHLGLTFRVVAYWRFSCIKALLLHFKGDIPQYVALKNICCGSIFYLLVDTIIILAFSICQGFYQLFQQEGNCFSQTSYSTFQNFFIEPTFWLPDGQSKQTKPVSLQASFPDPSNIIYGHRDNINYNLIWI